VNCPICNNKMDSDDVLQVPLEAREEDLKICEMCAVNVAEALFQNRTVKVWLDEGVMMMEVLP
jgi:hypothetical protein